MKRKIVLIISLVAAVGAAVFAETEAAKSEWSDRLTLRGSHDVRSAYISRGKVCTDHPIQANMLELDFAVSEYLSTGFWHWHYHDLTPHMRDKREQYLAEIDWSVYGAAAIPLADGWTLTGRASPRFFHEWFKHNSDHSLSWEWHTKCALENPYLTPYCVTRAGMYPGHKLYNEPGLRKAFALSDNFTLSPSTSLSFGDNHLLKNRFGAPENSSRYRSPLVAAIIALALDYRLTANIKLFTQLQQLCVANHQARNKQLTDTHKDWTILTAGVSWRF